MLSKQQQHTPQHKSVVHNRLHPQQPSSLSFGLISSSGSSLRGVWAHGAEGARAQDCSSLLQLGPQHFVAQVPMLALPGLCLAR
mmetsp:Transcript_75830/g.190775  ORF Transcript_75830/g.190775 Transcript_75830/m.190775 type:complete len:84 (+) Transcript_75830:1457-1708(+)